MEWLGCRCGCGQLYRSVTTTHPKKRVYIGASGLLDALIEPVQGSTLWASVLHFSEIMPRNRIYVLLPANRKPTTAIRAYSWKLEVSMGLYRGAMTPHLPLLALLPPREDELPRQTSVSSFGLCWCNRGPGGGLGRSSRPLFRSWGWDTGLGSIVTSSRVGRTLTWAEYGPEFALLGSRLRQARR